MLNTFQQYWHGALPRPTVDEQSRQEFAKSLKQFVQQGLLPGLGPVYQARAAKRFEQAKGRAPQDRHDIRKAMVPDPYFQHYAATNRISQELLWESVIDTIDRDVESVRVTVAQSAERNAGQLLLDPDFVVPRYVAALDIHCMPGGYAGEAGETDVDLGVLYDRGVYLYSMGYTG
ncbi:MAG: class I SAM-dependent methyltransferase, partial [Sphingobium sp.]